MTERVLVIGHGHPDMISGGGEIAAHECWKAYSAAPTVEESWFLARGTSVQAALGAAITGRMHRYRQNQYIWDQGLADPFMMKAANLHEVVGAFSDLVRALKPTVIHAHHYFMLGLEYLKVIKDIDPAIRTVMTLHEYMAICPNSGTMTRPETGSLCQSGAYDHHFHCAPDRSPEDHWLRYNRYRTYFSYVDHFVAPSDFLRDRYIEWGLAPERISVIRNGATPHQVLPPRALHGDARRNRFGFFGQINPLKGVDVVLKALTAMSPDQRQQVRFEIHGANLDRQNDTFQSEFRSLLEPLEQEGVATMMGPYAQSELPGRMAGVDWVMVPSIWYENAPLVIQEAFSLGRPVITSDLGGMKEAVRHGETGLCIPRGSVATWGETMLRLAADPAQFETCVGNLPTPITWDASAGQVLDLVAQPELEPA